MQGVYVVNYQIIYPVLITLRITCDMGKCDFKWFIGLLNQVIEVTTSVLDVYDTHVTQNLFVAYIDIIEDRLVCAFIVRMQHIRFSHVEAHYYVIK